MQSLQLKNITFKYPTFADYIFKELNLEFYQGWCGLIGANGTGKTTLLNLITKKLRPESGTVTNDLITAYCPQSTEVLPDNAEEFFTSYESKNFKLKDLLEIKEEWLYRWDSLSHGERKRVQIASVLFTEPDVLIVDEPTNHLDIQTKEKLFSALESFRGIGILVSHDRDLLDLLSNETIVLKKGSFTKIRSNFSVARRELNAIKNFQKEQKLRQGKTLKKLVRQIQSAKENVSRSKGRLSLGNVDKKDSDTKAKIYLAQVTGKNKGEGQTVKRALSKKEQILKKNIAVEKDYEMGIFFRQGLDERAFPLVIEETIRTINALTFRIPRLVIEKGDKIWVQGDNGSGKTTFINYLISIFREKEYLYIPQEISEKESEQIFKEVKNLSHQKQGVIFTTVIRLSSDPKALLQSKAPSAGEIRKLLIAKDLANNPPLIILDEPTNHMDLDSIVATEEALEEFGGAIIFISHDLAFCKNLANRIWQVERKGKVIRIVSK